VPASTRNGGNHGNQVMWRYGTGLLPARRAGRGGDAPVVADDGHLAVEAGDGLAAGDPNAERTQAEVLAAKPATASTCAT
jgi:hypothetical protein